MSDPDTSKRVTLVRHTVVFQLKLMVDGLRDLVLLPVSLVAALVGLLRGGDEPEREFLQVIEIGRESEHWINLFGNHGEADEANAGTSIDVLFTRVEETLKKHYTSAGTSTSTQAEIDQALKAAREEAQQGDLGPE